MNRKWFLFIFVLIILIKLTPIISQTTETTLQSLAKEFIDAFSAFHPVDATNMGIHQFDDRLAHYSTEGAIIYIKNLQNILAQAEQIKPELLSIDHYNKVLD